MSTINRKSLLFAGVAGLVFAAGAQAQQEAVRLATSPGTLAKSMREAIASRGTPPATIPFVPGSKQPAPAMGIERGTGATRLASPTGRYFVKLKQPSVVQHLAAARSGNDSLSLRSAAASSHEATVKAEQRAALATFGNVLGRSVTPALTYTKSLNGFSLKLSEREAAMLASHASVAAVRPVVDEPLLTDAGPALIGAPSIWSGAATGTGALGEGITVGIIDSGINSDHPSFAAAAGSYTHTNPYNDGYQGWCATPANADFCNDKLIGAYDFVHALVAGTPDISEEASPEDNNGHGSHTAGTVAGNQLAATFNGIPGIELSGVAPRANIIAYDACYTRISTGQGLCPQDATAASVEQAIDDGEVSVINFSIGGGIDPYNDMVSEAFLAATEMGIYVAAAAGNDGPGAATTSHQEPWVGTTAATTHGRGFGGTTGVTGPGTPPANVVDITYIASNGLPVTSPITDVVLEASVASAGNPLGCNAFPAGVFADRIALIPRGTCNFSAKVQNAQTAGASAVVIYNNVAGPALTMDFAGAPFTIPAVMIEQGDGQALAAFASANPTATLVLDNAGSIINGIVDMVADFSSRGPSSSVDVLKPDLAAPGVQVLAAVADGPSGGVTGTELDLISGTSMASPHHAGAVALLQELRPTWTPMQIKSALMLTAKSAGMIKEDETTPADPFDIGNGRIQLEQAANAGLVMGETIQAFVDANPADGGDVRTLNLASLYSSNCIGTANCVFERRFTNPTAASSTWDISFDAPPGVTMTASDDSITVAPGATVAVTFTADASNIDVDGGFQFGSVVLTDSTATLDPLHLAVAIQGSNGVLPETVTVQTGRDAGAYLIEGLVVPESTDLTFVPSGLVRGTQVVAEIAQDTTNSTPFDNLQNGVWFTVVEPQGFGLRLVAEILASEAPDLDLFIGVDLNGDGRPQANELIVSAATASALERAEVRDLPASNDYWILVQNWQGSGTGPDEFTLSYAFVPYADAGNLTVDAPTAPAPGVPFDALLSFDEAQMQAGERWYGALDLGTTPAGAAVPDIGTIDVDVIRTADDVVKTADVDVAGPTDTVTYTIAVAPNATAADVSYLIADTLPAGMTLVPGSAQASIGDVIEDGNTLAWTFTQAPSAFDYAVSDSETDEACTVPLANTGAYTDLAPFGINPAPNLDGEGPFTLQLVGGGTPYYGGAQQPELHFTANGAFSFHAPSIFAEGNGANQPIPNAALPNALLAPLWTDMVLDRAQHGGGISIAQLTDAQEVPVANIVEFDDLLLASDPSGASKIDLQVYVDSRVLEGAPEIVFAYANPTGNFASLLQGTIGIENADGSNGIELAYNDAGLQVGHGYAICFDLVPGGVPATLTYRATVDAFDGAPRTLTNNAVHENSAQGTRAETASASVLARIPPQIDLGVAIAAASETVVAGGEIVYTIDVSNVSTEAAEDVVVAVTLPAGLSFASATPAGWTCVDGTTVECTLAGTLAGSGTSTLELTVDVATSVVGDVTTSVAVSSSGIDPQPGNNTADTTVTVGPRADAIFSDGFED